MTTTETQETTGTDEELRALLALQEKYGPVIEACLDGRAVVWPPRDAERFTNADLEEARSVGKALARLAEEELLARERDARALELKGVAERTLAVLKALFPEETICPAKDGWLVGGTLRVTWTPVLGGLRVYAGVEVYGGGWQTTYPLDELPSALIAALDRGIASVASEEEGQLRRLRETKTLRLRLEKFRDAAAASLAKSQEGS